MSCWEELLEVETIKKDHAEWCVVWWTEHELDDLGLACIAAQRPTKGLRYAYLIPAQLYYLILVCNHAEPWRILAGSIARVVPLLCRPEVALDLANAFRLGRLEAMRSLTDQLWAEALSANT